MLSSLLFDFATIHCILRMALSLKFGGEVAVVSSVNEHRNYLLIGNAGLPAVFRHFPGFTMNVADIRHERQQQPGVFSLMQVETSLVARNCEILSFDDKYKRYL
jgi:hypothetical protein